MSKRYQQAMNSWMPEIQRLEIELSSPDIDDDFEYIDMSTVPELRDLEVSDCYRDWQIISHRKFAEPFSNAVGLLPMFIRNESNDGWATPDGLDPDVRRAMEAHILQMSPPGLERIIHATGRELDALLDFPSCFSCLGDGEIHEKRAVSMCTLDLAMMRACRYCVDKMEHPCAKLIFHPTSDEGYAIGVLPLPEDHRTGAAWSSRSYWVARYLLRSPHPKPSSAGKMEPKSSENRATNRSLRDLESTRRR